MFRGKFVSSKFWCMWNISKCLINWFSKNLPKTYSKIKNCMSRNILTALRYDLIMGKTGLSEYMALKFRNSQNTMIFSIDIANFFVPSDWWIKLFPTVWIQSLMFRSHNLFWRSDVLTFCKGISSHVALYHFHKQVGYFLDSFIA